MCEGELTPRSAEEVAQRLLALLVVSGRIHNPEDSRKWMEDNELAPLLSPKEAAYMRDPSPPKQDHINFSWRSEAAVPLVWALKMIDAMPPLDQQFDLLSVKAVRETVSDPGWLLADPCIRPRDQITEQEHVLLESHWRVRDARLFGKPTPNGLHPGIVKERRQGMSWIAGWGSDWDNVPLDT